MKKICFLLFILLLPGYGQRIVSLSPAITETLFHLGAGNKLVGRSSVCNYPPEAKKLPVAGDYATVYTEKLLSLKPDLVLTNDFAPGYRDILPKLGIRTVLLSVKSVEDYGKAVQKLGKLADCGKAAEKELKRIRKEIEYFSSQKYKKRPSVLWIIWHNPVMVAGEGSFPDVLLRLAGGRNAAEGVKMEYFKCSAEWLLLHEPDIVIWTVHGVPKPSAGFFTRLKAVREGRVIEPDQDSSLRPGPRMFDTVHRLKKFFTEVVISKEVISLRVPRFHNPVSGHNISSFHKKFKSTF